MIAVVQRVLNASVSVHGTIVGQIGPGMTVLAAIHADDTLWDLQWTAQKLVTLRIFPQGDKYFDQDIKAVAGGILLISNFTVAADTQSGRRPSLSAAASPTAALPLFDAFVHAVRQHQVPVETGRFGADMIVSLANDGPITFIVDSSTEPQKMTHQPPTP